MINAIKEIEKYDAEPNECPPDNVIELLVKINPKYRFIELIGIGGEGILIKCLDETGKKQIIIKVARSGYQFRYSTTPKNSIIQNVFSFKGNPKATNTSYERFLNGAILQRDLCQQLIDDNETNFSVPMIYNISTEPLYFEMPYLDNINIIRYFKDFNKNLKDILTVFIYLLRGIEYLHTKGIIHRDLKSDNILIGNKFKSVVLLDWTFSKISGDRGLTITGTKAGTGGIAPIKFFDGYFGNANFLDDIYCLGFVLWEFITGKRIASVWKPGDTYTMTKKKVEDFKRLICGKVPECLKAIFWKATEIEEKNRYQDVKDFKDAILQVLSNFDLRQNTLLSDEVSNEIEEKADIIFDTNCEIDYCKNCNSHFHCRKFGICNLLDNLLKEY